MARLIMGANRAREENGGLGTVTEVVGRPSTYHVKLYPLKPSPMRCGLRGSSGK
jgi:hypothetical protein